MADLSMSPTERLEQLVRAKKRGESCECWPGAVPRMVFNEPNFRVLSRRSISPERQGDYASPGHRRGNAPAIENIPSAASPTATGGSPTATGGSPTATGGSPTPKGDAGDVLQINRDSSEADIRQWIDTRRGLEGQGFGDSFAQEGWAIYVALYSLKELEMIDRLGMKPGYARAMAAYIAHLEDPFA